MRHIIEFILFLAYTIIVFFIKNYIVLGILFVLNLLLALVLKQNLKNIIMAVLKIMPFIIFTASINMLISGIQYGSLIMVRLILVCNMTYIFSKRITPNKLQFVVEKLLSPLKIFKIDAREIGIIVCIGITFIPIIQKEIEELKNSLKSKGFEVNLKNIIKKPNYILLPLITSIIKRIGEIEDSMYSKGYIN